MWARHFPPRSRYTGDLEPFACIFSTDRAAPQWRRKINASLETHHRCANVMQRSMVLFFETKTS
jgi:hypothetical protein